MIIAGIDPDSSEHGVAVYVKGKLSVLSSRPLMSMYEDFYSWRALDLEVEIHIENVCGMNAVFRQRQSSNAAISMKMANSVGRCQQSQLELERMAEYFGFKIFRHKISKTWKKEKAQFEKVTGWTGRSNKDTRSAAYFGWLGLKQLNDV